MPTAKAHLAKKKKMRSTARRAHFCHPRLSMKLDKGGNAFAVEAEEQACACRHPVVVGSRLGADRYQCGARDLRGIMILFARDRDGTESILDERLEGGLGITL